MCAAAGKADHNFIPLGDQIFYRPVRVGACPKDSAVQLFHAREVGREADWSIMPDKVAGANLLAESQVVLLVDLLKPTTGEGLVLVCGHRSVSSYVK
jgi:hypothetical protein